MLKLVFWNHCKQIWYFSQSFASVPLTYFIKHKANQSFTIAKYLLPFHRQVYGLARTLVNIEDCPRLTIQKKKKKMLVHHSYHAFLSIIMDGWLVINIVLVVQYIIGSLKLKEHGYQQPYKIP